MMDMIYTYGTGKIVFEDKDFSVRKFKKREDSWYKNRLFLCGDSLNGIHIGIIMGMEKNNAFLWFRDEETRFKCIVSIGGDLVERALPKSEVNFLTSATMLSTLPSISKDDRIELRALLKEVSYGTVISASHIYTVQLKD